MLEVTGGGKYLQVANALGVPPELLDYGPSRRGMSEAGYQLVLYTNQDEDFSWRAGIESWAPPKEQVGLTPKTLRRRFHDAKNRVPGPTPESALDALETELRELIRANPGSESDSDESP